MLNQTEWKNWFAWYPVAYGPHITWLKTIQRWRDTDRNEWWYRKVPNAQCAVHRVYKGK